MNSERENTGALAETCAFLGDDSVLRATVFHWEIWAGRPLLSRSTTKANVELPDSLQPVPFPLNFIRMFGEILFATTSTLLLWAVIPLLFLWGAGAVNHHSGVYLDGLRGAMYFLVFMVGVFSLRLILNKDERSQEENRSLRTTYSGMALPILMYLAAHSASEAFQTFNVVPEKQHALSLWLAFYGYIYVDILSLGAIESLFGNFASFQPASFEAALYTFLIRFLMTATLLIHTFKYFRLRVFGTEEKSGTFEELLDHLNNHETLPEKCYVLPLAEEKELADSQLIPSQVLFDHAHKSPWFDVKMRQAGGISRYFRPGYFLILSIAALTLLGLLLSVVSIGKWVVLGVLALLFVITPTIMIPMLAAVFEAARRGKCQTQLKELGLGCLAYKTEKRHFPQNLRELVDHEPHLINHLLCPSIEGKLNRKSMPTSVDQALALSGYRYFPDLEMGDSANTILIIEDTNHRSDRSYGGHVLFTDGRVEWFSQEELKALKKNS